MADDIDGMAFFVAVAETRGFRAAGALLGVSGSAVSQALRRLEARLGVALVQRTTRSVHLTEAGQQLYTAVRPVLNDLRAAVAAVGELAKAPRGILRLLVSTAADTFLAGPLLAEFLSQQPHVRIDVIVSDTRADIVAEGYDAGIQLFEYIDQDMIAVPVSGDLRFAVVGTPAYFARRGVPRHPRDLAQHECVSWHASREALPYRWEFTEHGRDFTVAVPWRVLSNHAQFNLRLVREGVAIGIAFDTYVRDDVARGGLVSVLAEFCTPFPGYYLYYPERRQVSLPLRALIEHVRATPAAADARLAGSRGRRS
jgi:DNA-binding transcriptional LysR family regulator